MAIPATILAGDEPDLRIVHRTKAEAFENAQVMDHHLDVYDHVQASDLMQASAVLASFVYHAAVRPEPLPRKPLPRPLPERRDPEAR